jgi:hypothetical protein
MDLSDGVAARLAAVCLDDDGRLREYDIWDTAARGALLVDLVRAGRLVDDPDSISVDPTPTGFAPADRLLAAMEVEPERPLTWWIDHGGVRLEDIAEACAQAGRWTEERRLLGRRFEVVAPEQAVADRGLDESRPDDMPPEAAAVAVLATACGARLRRPEPASDADLAATGPWRWICETVTAHLEQTHRHNLRAAGAADGGTVPYY